MVILSLNASSGNASMFFCVSPFPFSSHPKTNPHNNLTPTHIPWYSFHVHPSACFCPTSVDRQTLVVL